MFLTTFETLAKQEIQQIVYDLPDQMEGFGGQRNKKPVCIHNIIYSVSSDNFLMYPRTLRRNGCCSDQQSFHQLLKVLGEDGLEWRVIVRKEHLNGTKRLKKLFEQRKMRSRPGYRTDRHLICNPGTLRREKRQLRQYRKPRRSHGKSWIVGWIPTIFRQTKYFGRPSAVYVAKDRVSRTPSRILTVTF